MMNGGGCGKVFIVCFKGSICMKGLRKIRKNSIGVNVLRDENRINDNFEAQVEQ